MSNPVIMAVPSNRRFGGTAATRDTHHALVPAEQVWRTDVNHGRLRGLTFVAKDLFDVAGEPTGGGSPQLRAVARPPSRDSAAVWALLGAGSTLVGRAKCDALAYGLSGTDTLDGAPLNPLDPQRVPGGSSSGSAVAVATGVADLGLATDTGGSIRVPAAYCGIYGWRPTHGQVSAEGLLPLARSFDTVGLLARDARVLALGAETLLSGTESDVMAADRILLVEEARERCDPDVAQVLTASVTEFGQAMQLDITAGGLGVDLDRARVAFQTLQASEAWKVHGPWIQAHQGMLPPAVEARFRRGESVAAEQVADARETRSSMAGVIREAVAHHGVLALPAAPTLPPLLEQDPGAAEDVRNRTLAITSIAGLAGLPCVVVPLSLPMAGLCIVGPAGSDRWLLEAAVIWSQRQEQR